MNKDKIENLRGRIRVKDRQIVSLLNARAALSIEVGRLKNQDGLDIYDPGQEGRVHDYLLHLNVGPLSHNAVRDIYREIISASRALQAPVSVAYLGPEASFSHLAVLSRFGRAVALLPQVSISEVFTAVEKGRVRLGVVPVENSLEGSVKQSLDRLVSTPLAIRAEIFLRISHTLVSACENQQGIKRIYSHPQALAQCQGWLARHMPSVRLVESESTAGAARRVLEDSEGAAIGSELLAETYGLTVLAQAIEDHPLNTTRFFVIGQGQGAASGDDKTSIAFGTPHAPGGLHRALEPFARKGINLTRIESYPAKDRMWEYLFFADFLGHVEQMEIAQCLEELKGQTTFFKFLGSYPRGGQS
jgi:chorismate mutase/prephenate dehydratase